MSRFDKLVGKILPVPPKTVSGLNGIIPDTWDEGWQFYTDLTKDQIAAFQAMPEWQTFVAAHNAWVQSPAGTAPSLTVTSAAAQQLQTNINLTTIK